MNSLPLISHHLYVAAIANERRVREMPTRRDRSFAEGAAPANAIALEVMDDRKPWLSNAARPLRVSAVRVLS
jgi:hypothetical protein